MRRPSFHPTQVKCNDVDLLIDKEIGESYEKVKLVADNIKMLEEIANLIPQLDRTAEIKFEDRKLWMRYLDESDWTEILDVGKIEDSYTDIQQIELNVEGLEATVVAKADEMTVLLANAQTALSSAQTVLAQTQADQAALTTLVNDTKAILQAIQIDVATMRDQAQASAAAAAVSAGEAAVSATNATASASAAAASALDADESATQSSNSAISAGSFRDQAATSASESTASALEAKGYKNLAKDWAAKTPGLVVEEGLYSARHYANEAANLLAGTLVYMGAWDASTGALPASPVKGHFYVISVAGTIGGEVYNIGDQIIFNGTGWDHISNEQLVSSVAGRTGAVVLGVDDLTDITRLNNIVQVPWTTGVTGKPAAYPAESHTHTKGDVGLSNVDNTADIDKPVSTATGQAINTEATARASGDNALNGRVIPIESRMPAGNGTLATSDEVTSVADRCTVLENKLLGYTGRNAIINGAFRVWQRGNAFPAAVGTVYCADRWLTYSAGTTLAVNRLSAPWSGGQALADLGSNAEEICEIVVNSVIGESNSGIFQQRIEDVRTFAGRTVTLSFKAKASTPTFKIGLEFAQNFGAGGSAQVNGYGSGRTLTSEWKQYAVTVTLPSVVGKDIKPGNFLQITYWLDAPLSQPRAFGAGQKSGRVEITDIQVELGEQATHYEIPPDTVELQACQRYYEKLEPLEISGGAFNASDIMFGCAFATQKRSNPVMSVETYPLWVGNNQFGSTNQITFGAVNTKGFRGDVTGFSGTITQGHAYNLRGGVFIADAEF